jgi:hypothetical protein
MQSLVEADAMHVSMLPNERGSRTLSLDVEEPMITVQGRQVLLPSTIVEQAEDLRPGLDSCS